MVSLYSDNGGLFGVLGVLLFYSLCHRCIPNEPCLRRGYRSGKNVDQTIPRFRSRVSGRPVRTFENRGLVVRYLDFQFLRIRVFSRKARAGFDPHHQHHHRFPGHFCGARGLLRHDRKGRGPPGPYRDSNGDRLRYRLHAGYLYDMSPIFRTTLRAAFRRENCNVSPVPISGWQVLSASIFFDKSFK